MIDVLPNIAIVIPAFKADFLNKTLESLAKQTCKSFTVYVGDDCSPSDLKTIIKPFENILNVRYTRFERNLGGSDLVEHWNRCINLMGEEEYFILFSDDDELESECIAALYDTVKNHQSDIYHFDLQIIDQDGNRIGRSTNFQKKMSATDFFDQLFSGKIDARIPEFVFKKSHFQKKGGFVKFKDAIRSDTATVIKCALDKGIHTIKGPHTLWRDSGLNISTSLGAASKEKNLTFFSTTVLFFNWFEEFCISERFHHPWKSNRRFDYLYSYGYNLKHSIGKKTFWKILKLYRGYPRGISAAKDWLSLFLLKAKRKLFVGK